MDINLIITIFGFVALVAGGTMYIFSRLPKQTIDNYKAYVDSQEKRLKDLEYNDAEKGKQISTLQGRVDVLQTIPLGDIATAIKEIVNTQKEIIELITNAINKKEN
jgi:hypothetical protein